MNIREVIFSLCKSFMIWVVLFYNKGEEISLISDLDKFIKLVGNLEILIRVCLNVNFFIFGISLF